MDLGKYTEGIDFISTHLPFPWLKFTKLYPSSEGLWEIVDVDLICHQDSSGANPLTVNTAKSVVEFS